MTMGVVLHTGIAGMKNRVKWSRWRTGRKSEMSTSNAVPPVRNDVLHFALDSSNAENDEHPDPS